MTRDELKEVIRRTFADTADPGGDALVRSHGDEPDDVVALFRGKTDWQALSADYVDRAGAASPSALSFFSPARAQTQTWWEVQQQHFALLTYQEVSAIVEYLRWKHDQTISEHEQRAIADALRNYWESRARG